MKYSKILTGKERKAFFVGRFREAAVGASCAVAKMV